MSVFQAYVSFTLHGYSKPDNIRLAYVIQILFRLKTLVNPFCTKGFFQAPHITPRGAYYEALTVYEHVHSATEIFQRRFVSLKFRM